MTSRELLCDWLKLPAEPWPPTYYALLGLNSGEGSDNAIEQRVLERMEALRSHQLLHPEPVTEGMNLLAQAMVYLADPRARLEYDRQLGLPVEQRTIEDLPAIELLPLLPPERDEVPELIEEEPLELVEELEPPEALYPLEPLPDELPAEQARRPPAREQRGRRKLYAELARLRRVLRVWEKLRGFLDDADKTFARRTRLVALMSELTVLRPLLPTVEDLIGAPNKPGHLVAALARQELGVETLRSLLASQREALTKDCQSAHYVLLERSREVRAEVRRQTAKDFSRRYWFPLLRELAARPEWVCLAVGVLALAIAFIRSVPR